MNTSRNRVRSYAIAVTVLIGLAGIGAWGIFLPATDSLPEPPVQPEIVSERPVSDDAAVGLEALAPEPAVSGMRGLLLTTNENDRNHIFRLELLARGHSCPEVLGSGSVGNDGAVWRVSCEGTEVYFIEVDEFDRLVIRPAPYGDVDPSMNQFAPPVEQGNRGLEIR